MTDWLTTDRAEAATNRILDTAAAMFAERGVGAVTMRDVADAAGCSRATLYRYYSSRDDLFAAYVERAGTELAARIADAAAVPRTPHERLLTAITVAITGVRDDPALSTWFADDAAGIAARLAMVSPAIESVTRSFLADIAPGLTDADLRDRARWAVRVIVSLLIAPAGSAEQERTALARFTIPVLLAPPAPD